MTRTSSITRGLAAAVLVGACTVPAGAQDQSEFQPWQIPGWTFTPGLTVSTVFDNNVALAAEFPTRPETAGDKLFLVEPFGQLEYSGPRASFESGYRGYLRRYVDLDQLNGFDQHGYGAFRYRASRRLTLFMRDTFMKVPTTDELELNGVPFTRTGSRNNVLSGGVESRLSRYTDLNVRYEMNWVDFDRSATGVLLRSGYIHGVRTELARRLGDRSAFGGEYAIRLATLDAGTRQITFQDLGATYRYDTGPRTTFDAAAGVSHLIDRLVNDTRTGPYIRAGLTHRAQRATLGASYAREFVPTFGFGGSNQSQAIRGYVRMPLDRNRLYVQQSVAWRRSDPLISTELALDSFWLHSTLGYALSRWLRAEGFYAYTRQDSRVPGGLINRHRVGAQLVIAQPVRLR